MHYINEYSEISLHFQNQRQKERANCFVTKFLQKQNFFFQTYREEFQGVYFSWEELKLILGTHTYNSTLQQLKKFGFTCYEWTSSHNKPLYYFEPLDVVFSGKRVAVKDPYLNRNLTKFQQYKKKRLSPEAKIVYRNLSQLNYTCTEEQYREVMRKFYPQYKEEKEALRKPVLSLEDYLTANMQFYRLIEQFRQARGLERVNFIWEDKFGKRVHSILSSTPRALKESGFVELGGQPIICLDLHQSQPTILAHTLEDQIGENDFSSRFFNEPDIYQFMQRELNLPSRQSAKTKLFELLYGSPYGKGQKLFSKFFPEAGEYISYLKKRKFEENPSKKRHSNLCWLMQRKETEIFREIWRGLEALGIPFLPVHDEIIIQQKDYFRARFVFQWTLRKHLKKYAINQKTITNE